VTVGSDPAKKVTFSTEITQLSILRDTPLPKSIGHVKITLERTKGSDECGSGGNRPIYVSGITRYPLATSERLNFGVDDPRVALERFFLVESPPSGAFVWSSDRSTITLSGLAPASQHRVTLTFRDTGGFGDLELGPDEGHLQRVLITPGKTATPPEPFVATPEGTLRIALKTATWSPKERFKSEDTRNLGVAIRLITLDRVEGTSPSHERR
jgi:hypothetical protein